MNLQYQILCEVRVLHEYYLTDPNNASVFQATSQADRLAWFTRRSEQGLPAGSGDLQFVLSPAMTALFHNVDMHLLPSDSGFQLAIRTNPVTQGASTGYAPYQPIAGTVNFIILMKTGTSFPTITNSRMKRPVSALYYFSNVSLGSPKTAPALSRPISAFVSGYPYEQGELAANGSQIELFYYTGTGTSATSVNVPGDGFANENDRLIVPTTFTYKFEPSDNVSQAQFTLLDPSGNTVRTYSYGAAASAGGAAAAALQRVSLVFDDSANPGQPALTTLPSAGPADPILYSLEVTGNGGYTNTVPLIFYTDTADLSSVWGVIQLQVQVADNTFSLLDSNGLIYAPAPATPPNYPYLLFEIRCKSRYTFWQYQSEDPAEILQAPTGTIAEFLQQAAPGILTTLAPIPGTYQPYYFSENPTASPPAFTYLPNPKSDSVLQIAGNQVLSNIWVPASGIFPVSPAPT